MEYSPLAARILAVGLAYSDCTDSFMRSAIPGQGRALGIQPIHTFDV